MSTDPYKCVIDFNEKKFSLKSVEWKCNIVDGLHWIYDGRDETKDRVVVPPGYECIESFALHPDGSRTVNETYVPGVGRIKGSIPAGGVVWLKDVIQEEL